MAKIIDYNPLDLSSAMIGISALNFEEQDEQQGYEWEIDLQQDLDNIVEFLGGERKERKTRRQLDIKKAAEYLEKFGSYSLRSVEESYTPYTSTRKGWYSGNELMSRFINHLVDGYNARKEKKAKEAEEKKKLLNEVLPESEEVEESPKVEEVKPKNVTLPVKPNRVNHSIAALLTKMPYFSQNMFSVYFMYEDEKVDLYSLTPYKSSEAYQNTINGFGVRLNNFEIPQPKNQTYTVKVLDREIKKVASSFEIAHKVELTFEVDYMGMLLQHFQILSNGNPGPNADANLVINSTDKYYAVEMFPAAFGNRNKLKMVVLYNDMRDVYYKDGQKPIVENNFIKNGQGQIIGDTKSYRAFVFDDVQFLGINKTLDFSRDNASEMKVSTLFRFREMFEFDNNRIA